MKISKKDAKLLLYTVGILTLLLVFVWVYKPAQKENETLRTENEQLAAELAAREEHAANKDEYKAETMAMRAEIEGTLLVFPPAVREEDIIMYAHELETKSDMEIANVNIGALNQIYELGEGKYLNDTLVGYTFTVSYNDLKRTIEAIQNCSQKRNVENIVLSFDYQSAKIVGNINANFYSMTGTNQEYEEPEIPGISHGTNNIFGTITSSSKRENTENQEE